MTPEDTNSLSMEALISGASSLFIKVIELQVQSGLAKFLEDEREAGITLKPGQVVHDGQRSDSIIMAVRRFAIHEMRNNKAFGVAINKIRSELAKGIPSYGINQAYERAVSFVGEFIAGSA